jgi:hypothetical protein
VCRRVKEKEVKRIAVAEVGRRKPSQVDVAKAQSDLELKDANLSIHRSREVVQ